MVCHVAHDRGRPRVSRVLGQRLSGCSCDCQPVGRAEAAQSQDMARYDATVISQALSAGLPPTFKILKMPGKQPALLVSALQCKDKTVIYMHLEPRNPATPFLGLALQSSQTTTKPATAAASCSLSGGCSGNSTLCLSSAHSQPAGLETAALLHLHVTGRDPARVQSLRPRFPGPLPYGPPRDICAILNPTCQ